MYSGYELTNMYENQSMSSNIANSDISLAAYVRSRQIELADGLKRKAIYLDIKFWIILRDVVAGL